MIRWRRTPFLILGICFCCFSFSFGQESFSLEFPLVEGTRGASWCFPRSVDAHGIAIDIIPPNLYQHLVTTLIFKETQGGYLSVAWIPKEGSDQSVVKNFEQGSEDLNQGIFILPQAVLGEGGTLVFKGDWETLSEIRKIHFQWTDTLSVYGKESAEAPVIVQEGGRLLTARDLLNGEGEEMKDQSSEGIIRAVLSKDILTLKEGVAFLVPLLSPVRAVHFEAQVVSLPLQENLKISVNGYPARILSVNHPSLHDPGYLNDFPFTYAGWRKVAITLSAEEFQVGDNHLVIEANENAPKAKMKSAFLEVIFGAVAVSKEKSDTFEDFEEMDLDLSKDNKEAQAGDDLMGSSVSSLPKFRISLP